MVAQAADGVSALALQEQYLPEIIITDIRLPGMDGLELIYQVQQKYPATKFIVISGYSDFEYAKRAIQLQVSDYLLKPVKEEELCKSLSRLILSVQSAHNDLELELQTEGASSKGGAYQVLHSAELREGYQRQYDCAEVWVYSHAFITIIYENRAGQYFQISQPDSY